VERRNEESLGRKEDRRGKGRMEEKELRMIGK
jgi:hypothetical protein